MNHVKIFVFKKNCFFSRNPNGADSIRSTKQQQPAELWPRILNSLTNNGEMKQ